MPFLAFCAVMFHSKMPEAHFRRLRLHFCVAFPRLATSKPSRRQTNGLSVGLWPTAGVTILRIGTRHRENRLEMQPDPLETASPGI